MLRKARTTEAGLLTEISFASKRYWLYPDEYLHVWKDELTITADYIENNDVCVIENNGSVVGYYSIVFLKKPMECAQVILDKGYWLEHMFLVPQVIGSGLGRILFEHIVSRCTQKQIATLRILADPHAKGFYEKMGCIYKKDIPSTIAGRSTPLLLLRSTLIKSIS